MAYSYIRYFNSGNSLRMWTWAALRTLNSQEIWKCFLAQVDACENIVINFLKYINFASHGQPVTLWYNPRLTHTLFHGLERVMKKKIVSLQLSKWSGLHFATLVYGLMTGWENGESFTAKSLQWVLPSCPRINMMKRVIL